MEKSNLYTKVQTQNTFIEQIPLKMFWMRPSFMHACLYVGKYLLGFSRSRSTVGLVTKIRSQRMEYPAV